MQRHLVCVRLSAHAEVLSSCLPIALLAALFFALSSTTPAYAVGATIVNTTSLADDIADGKCSLREALQAAFTQKIEGKASVVYHECTVYAGPTTIFPGTLDQ